MATMRKIFVEVDAHGDGRGLERARNAWARKRAAEEAKYGAASGKTEAAE